MLDASAVREEALRCVRCPLLVSRRTQVVFGEGLGTSGLLIVGEAPGNEEDLRGRPFVGAAGRVLDAKLAAVGIVRGDAYVTNTAMCHPMDDEGKDRAPTRAEVLACSDYLDQQIALVRPRVIVTLGATALRRILGGSHRISRDHGTVFHLRGVSVVPTFHPSSLRYGTGRGEAMIEDLRRAVTELRRSGDA